jgi:lactoylglutathione lyase
MYLDHIALYTSDLERMKAFYEKYFSGRANALYHNRKTGLKTYFITFESGARLELMQHPVFSGRVAASSKNGLTHLAFCVGCREDVDKLTNLLSEDGYALKSAPRVTGDGYYESCILDPDGNEVEIVAERE